ITNQLLYRLSYTSASSASFILANIAAFVNNNFDFLKKGTEEAHYGRYFGAFSAIPYQRMRL
ncbi:MAG: hypothetical protein RSB39_00005, partial [Oscillospiraceae bacterium]